MWEEVIFSQNLFRIMLDPSTWGIAIAAVFAQPRRHPAGRFAIAVAISALLCFVLYVWPAGESGKPYAWKALMYAAIATGIWAVVLLLGQRFFAGGKHK